MLTPTCTHAWHADATVLGMLVAAHVLVLGRMVAARESLPISAATGRDSRSWGLGLVSCKCQCQKITYSALPLALAFPVTHLSFQDNWHFWRAPFLLNFISRYQRNRFHFLHLGGHFSPTKSFLFISLLPCSPWGYVDSHIPCLPMLVSK